MILPAVDKNGQPWNEEALRQVQDGGVIRNPLPDGRVELIPGIDIERYYSWTPPLDPLRSAVADAARAACAVVTQQVVPDQTHQSAYDRAAVYVAQAGGAAPTTEPAVRDVFAALGASVGLSDPDAFARVVQAVSLGAMQLSTILATLERATEAAQSTADLAAALSTFEASLGSFVDGLNQAGLTVTVGKPDPIVVPGVTAA